MTPTRFLRTFSICAAIGAQACASAASPGPSGGQDDAPPPRIVQPGAPGEATRAFEGGQIDRIEGAAHTAADVAFMQGMIHHHAQALRMTALVPERSRDEAVRQMALRMRISQTDEIAAMRSWLRAHGEDVPDVDEHHGALMHMPGMLTDGQMEDLRRAEGPDFDRYFLQYMIQHHGGAIVMVNELFADAGSGQESTINFFANEVDADQTIEIRRMQQMLQERR